MQYGSPHALTAALENPMPRRMTCLLVVAAACALTACRSGRSDPVHVGFRPYARTGGVDGFWQTPRGGKNGSTSARRPTFSEAGIKSSQEYGLDAHVDWGRHRLKLGYSRQILSGEATLTQDLTSQAASFPAGTEITTDSAIDWMQVHYQHRFDIRTGAVDKVTLWPGVGYKFASLHHVFDGSNGAAVSRHHGPSMPNLLLDWEWRPRSQGRLRFSGSAASSITVGSKPRRDQVIEILGRAHYDFSRCGSAFLESGYRDTVLRDDQPDQQNHLNLKFGPWIGIGAEFKF
jgi:hypothetical protein